MKNPLLQESLHRVIFSKRTFIVLGSVVFLLLLGMIIIRPRHDFIWYVSQRKVPSVSSVIYVMMFLGGIYYSLRFGMEGRTGKGTAAAGHSIEDWIHFTDVQTHTVLIGELGSAALHTVLYLCAVLPFAAAVQMFSPLSPGIFFLMSFSFFPVLFSFRMIAVVCALLRRRYPLAAVAVMLALTAILVPGTVLYVPGYSFLHFLGVNAAAVLSEQAGVLVHSILLHGGISVLCTVLYGIILWKKASGEKKG